MAAELLKQRLQQQAHRSIQLTAWSGLRGQQQQRTGIHQRGSLLSGELDQMLFAAMGDAQEKGCGCIARYGVKLETPETAVLVPLWDQAKTGPLMKIWFGADVLPGPIAAAVSGLIEHRGDGQLQLGTALHQAL